MKKRIYIKELLISFLPAICTYLASSENALDRLKSNQYIGDNIDISQAKNFFLCISILLTFLLLTIRISKAEYKRDVYEIERTNLLSQNKDILLEGLKQQLNVQSLNLDIRIFVPERKFFSRLRNKIIPHEKKYFIINNINCLGKAGKTNNLKFEVSPNQQGLVGSCFSERSIQYDDNLYSTNNKVYNLTPYQIQKTDNLRFSLVCPLFSPKDEIVAIMAFDSTSDLKISTLDQELQTKFGYIFQNYSQLLFENVPELFSERRRII